LFISIYIRYGRKGVNWSDPDKETLKILVDKFSRLCAGGGLGNAFGYTECKLAFTNFIGAPCRADERRRVP